MNLPFLGGDPWWFPPTSLALDEPNGLLAAGGDLKPERLVTAYSRGIFPWYQDGQPILWWSPTPRMVLNPNQCHVSKSMRKFMRQSDWQVVIDHDFQAVISACAESRIDSGGTWITQDMHDAYVELHQRGFCHSIEVYSGEGLVGGLYGVALGRIFFGESMFTRLTNASKLALIVLSRFLQQHGFRLIDCQVASDHLHSLGAMEVSRSEFELELSLGITEDQLHSAQVVWHKVKQKTLTFDGYIAD